MIARMKQNHTLTIFGGCRSRNTSFPDSNMQRWSPRGRPWPRGHILKTLALASKPQVLENWPVLGSRTALFFELLKFCGALEKVFGKRFLWISPEKFL